MGPHNIVVMGGDFPLSQDAAAVLAGVTVQTMINWAKQDNPPPRNANGSYSAKEYGEWLIMFRALKTRGRPRSHPEELDDKPKFDTILESERRLKLAQAIKFERENEVAAGRLIELDVLEPLWQRILMRVRGRFLKMPTILTPLVLGDTDAHSIQSKIKDAVHDALTELSQNWQDDERDVTND